MNIKPIYGIVTAIALVISTAAFAQVPEGSTGVCKDGTFTNATSKRGACSGHKGVKEWYAKAADSAPAAPVASPTNSTAVPSAKTAAPATKKSVAPSGNGQVWVNTDSNVYHCEGTRWYGKTKQGEYMSEAAAKKSGARPDHGKACS